MPITMKRLLIPIILTITIAAICSTLIIAQSPPGAYSQGGGTLRGAVATNQVAYGDSSGNGAVTSTNDLFFQNGLLIVGNGTGNTGTIALTDNGAGHHPIRLTAGANSVDMNLALPPTLPTAGQIMTVQSISSNSPILQWSSSNSTATNCAAVGTAANPSVATCSSAAAGHFSCATNASTGTCQVNTTAVTANSEIFVFESDTAATGTALGVTCNTTTTVNPATRLLASSVAATSFTINLGTVTANPACFSYWIVN